MAVNSIGVRPTLGSTADTNRLWSPVIWEDCPWSDLVEGNVQGVYFFDDFLSFPITPPTTEGNWSQYAMFSSTGGTATAGTGQGGELTIGSDGDNEGASLRTLAVPFKIARTTKKFWFECRVKSSTITDTKHGFFIGLWENVALTATVPIAAAGTLSDNNFCGFHRLEGDGDQIDTVYKADGVTQVSVQTDALPTASVLVADTYIKLGMVFEPDIDPMVHDVGLTSLGKYNLTFYANGVRLTTRKQIPSAAGTDFPNDVALGLAFAVLNATGTTPGTSTIDWWRAAQII
jgi:hypothetical protein